MGQQVKIKSYRDLLVWLKAMTLAKQVYSLAQSLPIDERFGLVAQMRRAAVSIPSKIAEGQARNGKREFVLSLSHSKGSLADLDTQIALAIELGLRQASNSHQSVELIGELQKMLTGLRRKVETRLATYH